MGRSMRTSRPRASRSARWSWKSSGGPSCTRAPNAAPKLTEVGDQFGTLDVAGSVYRHFPRGGWDLERRLQDMAASKVDLQVLSVCPQTFLYAQPPAVAAAFARVQNEQIAKLV